MSLCGHLGLQTVGPLFVNISSKLSTTDDYFQNAIYLNTIKFFLINKNFFHRIVYFLHENVIYVKFNVECFFSFCIDFA